jgi:hypothetical protein
VLTLPASFDEVARELTVQAAALAAMPRVVLIEEPQAAFYAWVDRHRDDWPQRVQPGQKILVCDVGGGTSDFTLIRVRRADDREEGDRVQFHRIAVGEHLMLGGDNLDLALAKFLEERLIQQSVRLDARQWDVLVRSCRQAKETLLSQNPPGELTVHLPGTGSRLVGGGLQVTLTQGEAEQVLVDGFFPEVALGERPLRYRSGFQEFGLPYAADPAVTRHLAAFLTEHRYSDDAHAGDGGARGPARPGLVLIKGGGVGYPNITQRLNKVIACRILRDGAPRGRRTHRGGTCPQLLSRARGRAGAECPVRCLRRTRFNAAG